MPSPCRQWRHGLLLSSISRTRRLHHVREAFEASTPSTQLGYVVDDLEQAARAHSALFGSGPFIHFSAPEPKRQRCPATRRCETSSTSPTACTATCRFEPIKPTSDGPTPYTVPGRTGFNHFSVRVDDFDAAIRDFAEAWLRGGHAHGVERGPDRGLHRLSRRVGALRRDPQPRSRTWSTSVAIWHGIGTEPIRTGRWGPRFRPHPLPAPPEPSAGRLRFAQLAPSKERIWKRTPSTTRPRRHATHSKRRRRRRKPSRSSASTLPSWALSCSRRRCPPCCRSRWQTSEDWTTIRWPARCPASSASPSCRCGAI